MDGLVEVPGSVLVTATQWRTVLVDADLVSVVAAVDVAVESLAAVDHMTKAEVGRGLFGMLDGLLSAYRRALRACTHVRRFTPPDDLAGEVAVLLDLQRALRDLTHAAIDWVVAGAEVPHPSVSSELRLRVHNLLGALVRNAPGRPADEDPFQRSLGLSGAALTAGDGHSFQSRIMAAWAAQPNALDERLFTQFPHLLDPAVQLTSKVRVHAAALLAGVHCLPAHGAAVAGRDLVERALSDRRETALAAIADGANDESAMHFTHRRRIAAINAFNAASHTEDKVVPACDMYMAVLEGDVGRTASTVLRLLGRNVEPDTTLGRTEQDLASETTEPMCELLRSCIDTEWRNAIAHDQVRWDARSQRMLMRGQTVTPDEVARATFLARDVCAGFETGVAVALNHAGNPHHNPSRVVDSTAWDSHAMREVGARGVSVLRYRRAGAVLQLDVAPLDLEALVTVFKAIFDVAPSIPEDLSWVVRQDGRPDIIVEAATVDTAADVIRSIGHSARAVAVDAGALVLCAGALAKHGTSRAAMANTVAALAAATVVGERNSLRTRALLDEANARTDLTQTIVLMEHALRAAAKITGVHELDSFAQLLSEQAAQHRLFDDDTILFRQIDHARRLTSLASLPWLSSNGPQSVPT